MVPASVLPSMPSLPPPAPLFAAARAPREETRRWTLAVALAVAVQGALLGAVSWSTGHGPASSSEARTREVEVVFQAPLPKPSPAPAPAPAPRLERQRVAQRTGAPAPAPLPEPLADAPPPAAPEVAAPPDPVAPWDLALVGVAGDGKPEAPAAARPAGTGDTEAGQVGEAGDAAAGQGPGGAGVDLEAYGADLSRAITTHRRYPPQARRLRLEGTVLVEVDVAPNGTLAGEPVVARSSGHAVLDEEALRMVRAAAPFPALPAGVTGASARFVLPVHFGIRG